MHFSSSRAKVYECILARLELKCMNEKKKKRLHKVYE